MSPSTLHPLAGDYLDEVRAAGRRLPRPALRELVDDLEEQLNDAIGPGMTDRDVRSVLAELGHPRELVAAQQPPAPPPLLRRMPRPPARGNHEWAAIGLLLVGGFFFGVGWLAGLVLLWTSQAWSLRDKWIGTLVVPGGLASALTVGLITGTANRSCSSINGGPLHCTGGPTVLNDIFSVLLLMVLVLAPLATAVHLAREAG